MAFFEIGKFNDNVINKIYNKGLEIEIKMTGLALVGVRDLAGVRVLIGVLIGVWALAAVLVKVRTMLRPCLK